MKSSLNEFVCLIEMAIYYISPKKKLISEVFKIEKKTSFYCTPFFCVCYIQIINHIKIIDS